MRFYLETFKVSNFLSFFGEYEINFKPFTGIMCNYYEGKNDFLKALEFVFGGPVAHDDPLNFVHRVVREEFLVNREVKSYVEVTIQLVDKNKWLSFRRSIRNGNNIARIQHAVSGVITSKESYDAVLHTLNLNIRKTNLIFYKSDFSDCIWGSSEDLERTMNKYSRTNYLLEEWKKARKDMKHWSEIWQRVIEKNYNSIKKSHFIVSNLARNFEEILLARESSFHLNLRSLVSSLSDESVEKEHPEEIIISSEVDNDEKVKQLDTECDYLAKRICNLKMKMATLVGNLHYRAQKLGVQMEDRNDLCMQINGVKKEYLKKKQKLLEIFENINETSSELQSGTEKIFQVLMSWNEKQETIYLYNRFTTYGRFVDYLQPSQYVEILRQIIGNEIYYAHLCDSFKTALNAIELMKSLKYERREKFIVFENYPHELKDVLTASGENGVALNNLEQLLIFLCKLARYEIIPEVPIIVQSNFDFSSGLPSLESYFLYVQDNLHFTADGLITYKYEAEFWGEAEEQLQEKYIQLKINEQVKYQELKDLSFASYEILNEMGHLENDIFHLQHCLKKSKRTKFTPRRQPLPLDEVYQEYGSIFMEFEQEKEDLIGGSDDHLSESQVERNVIDITQILNKIEQIRKEKDELESLLQTGREELRRLNVIPVDVFKLKNIYVGYNNNLDKSKFFYDKEFKKLKNLIEKDDLEDFLGSQEWRESFIAILINDSNKFRKKIKIANQLYKEILEERKMQLEPLMEHCNRRMSTTFSNVLGNVLPYLKLKYDANDNLQLGSVLHENQKNAYSMEHFNTFLKFAMVLTMLLEISVHKNIPLIILEDIEEFFPSVTKEVEDMFEDSVLQQLLSDSENAYFQLLMQVGQFLSYFIRKNTPRRSVRNNGSSDDYIAGPMQMIYFCTGDLINAAEHFVWIHWQVLPEQYISDECNWYSAIHELKFH